MRLWRAANGAEEHAGVLLRVVMTSRPTVLASIVLALALLGDSLLYAVLPLHAATFGISLAFAGVLLSANRIIRLFVYPVLPHLAATGLRRFTMTAAALGAMSTLTFSFASGAWPLLASRIAWGVAFGSLSLSTLAYATSFSGSAGSRVGLSLSVRELGPLLSLTAGTAAVAAFGARPTLVVIGAMSLSGVLVAGRLPEVTTEKVQTRPPGDVEWLSFIAGLVTDGIFPATVGLLLARSQDAGVALIGAGLLLAFKRAAVLVLAPIGGHAADRFDGRNVTAAGLAITATGTTVIAAEYVIIGALVLSCGAAITTTSIPVAIVTRDPGARVSALARAAMARDAGAAAGPLIALPLFDATGPAVLYLAVSTIVALSCCRSALQRRPEGDPSMASGNEHEVKGKLDQAKGAIKEGFGALTGDRSTEIEGKAERAKGALREGYGRLKNDLDTNADNDLDRDAIDDTPRR